MRKNLRKCFFTLSCLVILLAGLLGCGAPHPEKVQAPIVVTDQLGRTVNLDKIPQRIISLAPGNTEILFALGLADRVVAVTDYCDYPPEVEEKPSIGGFSTPNIEQVVAYSPDLVLATAIHEKKVVPQLEGRGLTVFVLAPKTLDDVLEAITLVGKVTGKEEEASQLAGEMQKRIEAVTEKTANLAQEQRPRVFYLSWHDPLITAGSGTILDELIEKAGGTNIARELTGYAEISLEAVIEANPEVMIAGVGMGTGDDLPLQLIKTESRLRNTDARRHNRVYAIHVDLTGRFGPRIVDGLEKFAEFIHPELFEEAQ
jgi:iron complex transport system substrate-binding protein